MNQQAAITSAAQRAIAALFPSDRISADLPDRIAYSRDLWPRTLIGLREGQHRPFEPDTVVWPVSLDELRALIEVSIEHRFALIPFGGGSGVCGGAVAQNGGVIVDLKRLDQITQLCDVNLLADVQAGIIGQTLEDQLNVRGLTLGHFPSSIRCSTLGGWLATRSAGQCSSRYGKIEDMVDSVGFIDGTARYRRVDRANNRQQLEAIIGSEGVFGFITDATMRLAHLPQTRMFLAYRVPSVERGCEALRRILQAGLRPAVLRLYDELDTLLSSPAGDRSPSALSRATHALTHGGAGKALQNRLLSTALRKAGNLSRIGANLADRLRRGCLMIVGVEGDRALAEAEAAYCHEQIICCEGDRLDDEIGISWFENRYGVSFKMSPLFMANAFVDTMEVAAPWHKLMRVYRDVHQALSADALVLAHFSHAYTDGCSIYFTFVSRGSDRTGAQALYDRLWQSALAAADTAGAAVSHHHGIGLAKAEFMKAEHGHGMTTLRALKTVFDPHGIMNPGKLGL
ncbi:MAG: FAD-binding oxidoreductase [Deltaproteobacteria bacterium]|nr:FAD-binding oxidoreductase [Deltaproteobacteria bacterium]